MSLLPFSSSSVHVYKVGQGSSGLLKKKICSFSHPTLSHACKVDVGNCLETKLNWLIFKKGGEVFTQQFKCSQGWCG